MKHIKNKLKPPKAFEKWCLNQIPIYEWSNNDKTIRSSDREFGKVIKKQLRSNSKLTIKDDFYTFAIVLITKKRIEIQSYAYWLDVVDGEEDLYTRMTNFEKFENDEHIKRTYQFGDWVEGLSVNYSMMGGAYYMTKFYPNDWEERIKTVSELKYIDFGDIEIERWALNHWYKHRFKIEYLQKIKNFSFANDLLEPNNRQIDMRVVTQKYLKENKSMLMNNDMPFNIFELDRRLRIRNGKYIKGVEKYMHYKHVEEIPKQVGVIRFQNWLIRNQNRMEFYLDYLSLLKDLEIEITSERILLPHDLTQAHDELVCLLNDVSQEKEIVEFRERFKELEELNQTVQGLAFVVPRHSQDLIKEGNALNHCVGTSRYINRHRKGTITLAFIRDPNNKDESLYTCEIENGRIIQIRGKSNKKAPEEVFDITETWLKENEKHLIA